MASLEWQFPDNGRGAENGLDTPAMETFRKDPVASLAREICQNSIDAALDEKPVRVEFSTFTVPRSEIPGIKELTQEINSAFEYKKNDPKEGAALEVLKDNIEQESITCLRISDFNTTGLEGVDSEERSTPFYNLTRGSGVSDKLSSSGGSKGIGKYASFVVSGCNTVFYSTQTVNGASGYLGISKLRSVPRNEEDAFLMSEGTGYFSQGDRLLPIPNELVLDKEFSREKGESGTDVYLIGFSNKNKWKEDIVVKVLESFMVAIIKGKLEVKVEDMELTRFN